MWLVSACFPPSIREETEMPATTLDPETAPASGRSADQLERLYTIKEAADLFGVKYWLMLHAINAGTIPSYRLGNTRRRVRRSDIEAVLEASRR
jgi:excisionase family DNA binding protein